MRVVRSAVLLGSGLLGGFMGAAAVAKRALPSRGDADSDEVGLVAIFDGVNLKSSARAFRGGSALAWFGGVNVDLREAELAPEAHLSVGALFGGVALRVPPHWRVESDVRAIGGGVAVSPAAIDDPDAPTLTVAGLAVMGGVAVSRKASPAEEG